MCRGGAGTGTVTDTEPCGSWPLGDVMGAILPNPPSGKSSGGDPESLFSTNPTTVIWAWVQCKSESRNPATAAGGNRRRLVPLRTLTTRDFDELAGAFPRWDLRFRQLGGGPFRGELQFLELGAVQVVRVCCNRRIQAQGSPPPGSFGFAPVLPMNEGALWRGRRCRAGQFVTIDPSQQCDQITTESGYEFVALTVDGEFFRQCAAVLGGFDPEERLVGRLAVTSGPARCRALTAHLRDLLARAEARPDPVVPPRAGRAVEQECVRRVVEVIAQSAGGDRTVCWSSARERLVRRADDYMRSCLGGPLSLLELCRELGVSERTLL